VEVSTAVEAVASTAEAAMAAGSMAAVATMGAIAVDTMGAIAAAITAAMAAATVAAMVVECMAAAGPEGWAAMARPHAVSAEAGPGPSRAEEALARWLDPGERALPTGTGTPLLAPAARVDRRSPRAVDPQPATQSTAQASADWVIPQGAAATSAAAIGAAEAGAAATAGVVAGDGVVVGALAWASAGIRSGIGHRTITVHGCTTTLRPISTRIRTRRDDAEKRTQALT